MGSKGDAESSYALMNEEVSISITMYNRISIGSVPFSRVLQRGCNKVESKIKICFYSSHFLFKRTDYEIVRIRLELVNIREIFLAYIIDRSSLASIIYIP